MFDKRPTYEISAAQIKDYLQPLAAGTSALPFEAMDEFGRKLNLNEDYLSGKHLILVFLNNDSSDNNCATLQCFANNQAIFSEANITVLAVSATINKDSNLNLKQRSGFIWPILNDPSGSVFASYGLHKSRGPELRVVLITPQRQIKCWYDSPINIEDTLKDITAMAKSLSAYEDSRWSAGHAPVLHVPNVLSEEECARLIQLFNSPNSPEGFFVRPPRAGEVAGNYKVPVYEHNRQDRVDQIIKDKSTLEFLDQRIWGRINPMIKKAFVFDVTRREDLHIARYVGAREGFHMGHRDVTTNSMTHRRFALSLALNNDYEGGELVFNEYSPHGYKPATGSALIFSSLLLHEVTEITQGTRYNLVSNLFNDDALK